MEDKVKEITEQLEKGVSEVFTSGRFREFLDTMGKFHEYSFNNCILIMIQKPDATYVAGFQAWKTKFKRNVKKGEKAIRILAPMPRKGKKEVTLKDGTVEEQEYEYIKYRAVPVFDISQTEGEELPMIAQKLTASVDGYQELIDKLVKISPVPVSFEDIHGSANGYYSHKENRIVVKSGMSESQTLKTLVHEIAHSLLHGDSQTDRNTAEVEAESVSYVVMNYMGVDSSDYSFGYVAGWSSGKDTKELKSSLCTIQKTANEIIDKYKKAS